MIRYLQHKDIDKKKWNETVSESSNALVYAASWYLDIVSPGWDALIEDDYNSVFPLTHNKKYGIEYLRQPHFTQQLGVFKKGNISERLVKEYLNAIPDKFRFIEINLNTENHFSAEEFKIIQMLTHHLDLNRTHESIFKNYSENLKRNIARAKRLGISLTEDADENKIIHLFRQNKGKDVPALKTKDYNVLGDLIKEARKRKLVQVIGANTSSGEFCAGAVFIRSFEKIIFLFSAASAEAKKSGAMSLIIDQVIQANSLTSTTLDFEGSMDKNLARFYKSFNSKEAVYLRIQRNNLPKFVRWMKR